MRILFGRQTDGRPESMPATSPGYATLAGHLGALASETRLELLHALRTPQSLNEIRVLPSLTRGSENPERALSRQAVTRHMEQLLDLGLLHRMPAAGGRGDLWVLNHERLFAIVDEIRSLAKLRPLAGMPSAGETVEQAPPGAPRLPTGPRLLVAYGRDDGVAFALDRPVGGRWTIGRAPTCDIRLDYDPYNSGENSRLEHTAAGFSVEDLGSRNGTWVNWERLAPRRPRALRSGDLLTVGRSILVFQL